MLHMSTCCGFHEQDKQIWFNGPLSWDGSGGMEFVFHWEMNRDR